MQIHSRRLGFLSFLSESQLDDDDSLATYAHPSSSSSSSSSRLLSGNYRSPSAPWRDKPAGHLGEAAVTAAGRSPTGD